MRYRLAITLGSSCMGWCALKITTSRRPAGIVDMGVRAFHDGRDPQSGQSLAVVRRQDRQRRRRRHRVKQRQKRLMDYMIGCGLMPASETERKGLEQIDPYEVRAKALDEAIPLAHLGRALLHISKRRGFKSKRKAGAWADDGSRMKAAIRQLEQMLQSSGSRTLGEYLHQQQRQGKPARVRTRIVSNGIKYNFYTSRVMYEREVDAILRVQMEHHAQLTSKVCDELRDILFYERPMKALPIGRCPLEIGEPRALNALPLVRKFQIWQAVNQLEVDGVEGGARPLDRSDRQRIVEALLSSEKKSFAQIRRLVGRERDCRLNLETPNRTSLAGDSTTVLLAGDRCFGAGWRELSDDQQEQVIELLISESDSKQLKSILTDTWHLSPEQADAVISLPVTGPGQRNGIHSGFCHYSKAAILKILPWLEQGYSFREAAEHAGYRRSNPQLRQKYNLLPYYGQVLHESVVRGSYVDKDKSSPERYYGKVNQPSLHIAFNQLRKLVNALIETHGVPHEIVVEIARDLKEPGDEIARKHAKNRRDIDRLNKELDTIGVSRTYRNRLLFSLWEDLADDPELRCCPFSGMPITKADIFSGEYEETYLLPFSRSYDGRRKNMVLCSREWNQRKGSKSPFEAFGHRTDWPQMLARAGRLPPDTQRRFRKDAWSRIETRDGVIPRLLNDDHRIAQWTREYIVALLTGDKRESRVWAVQGNLTRLFRREWKLDELLAPQETAADLRHRAIDAVVIALTDERLLRELSESAFSIEQDETLRARQGQLLTPLPVPFDGFRRAIESHLQRIIVSWKPDRGGAARAIRSARPYTVTPLHRETALGFVHLPAGQGTAFATRIPAERLLSAREIEKIADSEIRRKLFAAVKGLDEGGDQWKQAMLAALAPGGVMKNGIRRVRVHIAKTDSKLIGLFQSGEKGKEGAQPFKYYQRRGNYCAEIFCADKGRKAGKWQCEIISNFDAHQKDYVPDWRRENPTAQLIMRLQKNDMVAYENEGKLIISRVKKLAYDSYGGAGVIYLRQHMIDREIGNTLTWNASARQLQLRNARKVSIDITGKMKDPGRSRIKAAAA